ncbi:Cytochrome P450 [Neofusicoccum parvum]|nr:Cytochrome P450 [Neofusicoccum parvum]
MSSSLSDNPWAMALANPKIPQILGALLAFLILKVVATCIYNIYFHPLRYYPGPKYAVATDLAFRFVSLRGDVIPWTHQIHEQYGEAVRLGPNRLSFVSPQAWKDIYGHRTGGKKPNPKDTAFYTLEPNGEASIFAIRAEEDHSSVRRIFSAAFSDKALRQQEPLIRTYVDKLISNMQGMAAKDPGAELDLVRLLNFVTFDIIGDLTFGEPLGLLENSEYSPWVAAIFNSLKAGDVIRNLNELEKGSVKPDFWNLVLGSNKGKISVPQMHAHGASFMLAGTETTATILSGLIYLLLKNPDTMQKIVEEVRQVQTEEELTFENLARMKYLAACLQEAFRCYPPVSVGLPRVTPPGGNAICGKWVPENRIQTRVSVPQWAASHSKFNFERPYEFIPERWLPGTGFDSDNKDIVQPFSIGPRNCLGKNLAYHESRVILAKILWHFDLKLGTQSDSWMDQKLFVLWKKEPLMVSLSPVH